MFIFNPFDLIFTALFGISQVLLIARRPSFKPSSVFQRHGWYFTKTTPLKSHPLGLKGKSSISELLYRALTRRTHKSKVHSEEIKLGILEMVLRKSWSPSYQTCMTLQVPPVLATIRDRKCLTRFNELGVGLWFLHWR